MLPDELRKVSLFSSISLNGLSALESQGQPRAFPAGHELMRQGKPGQTMYVILKGRVRVERSHPDIQEPLVLSEMGQGEVVGEMALLDGEPRLATVTAIEDLETLEISADALTSTMLQFPDIAAALLHILSRRLRSTDELAAHQHREVNEQE
ncbi:MAG: cyclic nucleotide-binding domain-containing protein [Chloroflexi bacterium]|nr:cyclic nucleotide-binding domain-containing protein [Chloroflexota bacterium]